MTGEMGMDENITDSELYEQACDLIFALHDNPTELTRARLDKFKAQSAQHRAASIKAEEKWMLLGQLELEEPSLLKKAQYFIELKTLSLSERPQKALPFIAALLVVLFLPKLGLFNSPAKTPLIVETSSVNQPAEIFTYTTPYGRQAEYTLEDGSVLSMNWNTQVMVDYTEDSRLVTLIKGEALFTVAKDPDHPFIVSVDNIQARAVGTEFSVQRVGNNYADIAVIEGIVEVSIDSELTQGSSANQLPSSIQLLASQTLIAKDNALGQIQSFSIEEIGAWRSGMLVFEGRPIEEVLVEINRYTPFNIVTENLSRVQEEVTATFFIDDAEDSLRTLVQAFGLQTESRNNARVTTVVVSPGRPVKPNRL